MLSDNTQLSSHLIDCWGSDLFCQQVVSIPDIMQPNSASRHPIIEIDINEVVQGSDNPRASSRQSSAMTSQQRQGSLDQRAARQGTPATGQGSLDSGSLNPHASPQGSLNPPVAGTGWVTRPARCQAKYKSHGARVTQLGVTRPARVSARVTQPTSCWDRITRPWVTRPARCWARSEICRARVTRLWVSQPTRVSARITRSTSCQSTDQRIERVISSTGAGSSGRR